MKVRDHKILSPALAMQWSAKQIFQWQEAQKGVNGTAGLYSRQLESNNWMAPVVNSVKDNVDASVYTSMSILLLVWFYAIMEVTLAELEFFVEKEKCQYLKPRLVVF